MSEWEPGSRILQCWTRLRELGYLLDALSGDSWSYLRGETQPIDGQLVPAGRLANGCLQNGDEGRSRREVAEEIERV
jgi:hypothetical protein